MLILDDGTRFYGKSFGAEKPVAGEVVFNTAMTGYPESLTDPSYAGQLMTLTYPLIGNYGVPPFTIEKNGIPTYMESGKIHAEAIIVSDYSTEYSHWNAAESLDEWLKREQVPGITGIDTRALTMLLREHGVMMGRIEYENEEPRVNGEVQQAYGSINFVDKVSCKQVMLYTGSDCHVFPTDMPKQQLSQAIEAIHAASPAGAPSARRICLVDCGVKANILRCLLRRGVEVIRVPWDYDFNGLPFDGLFISNGPGDPDTCEAAVRNIRTAMANHRLPIFGICMGNQLLAKAGGASIYKLKYGHRSHNQPVRMVGTDRCYITSQNHGYAVDNNTLGKEWEPLFINMNDGSNEGIRHRENPWFSAQFHPEAASGPTDTEFLFDNFLKLVEAYSGEDKK